MWWTEPPGGAQSYLFEHEVAVLLWAAGEGEQAAEGWRDGEHRLFVLDLIPVVQSQSPDLLLQHLVLWHAEIVRVCGVTDWRSDPILQCFPFDLEICLTNYS